MPSNCGAGENPWKSFAQQGDQTNLKENQPWILIGRTNAEAEAPVFWSFDVNSKLIGKVPDPGKDWGQKEKRVSEDEVAGLHYWYNGHELGQTSGDGEGQGGLVCCSPWGLKESDMGHDWIIEQQCVCVILISHCILPLLSPLVALSFPSTYVTLFLLYILC